MRPGDNATNENWKLLDKLCLIRFVSVMVPCLCTAQSKLNALSVFTTRSVLYCLFSKGQELTLSLFNT